jgi:eukaryotic-like serine/threonine-protein kinase
MAEITSRLSTALADRYRIERQLGEGGMATVYLAHDLKHDRKVALKVLRPELAAILGAERFLSEIKVTANLQHPNILPLYDSGEADTFLYYVMPYVEGATLREKLDRQKQLGVGETVDIAKSVASALRYAHDRGVIHRDVKPENILLQSGQALVADFGIALAVSQAGRARITETGLSLGTPQYMSPEQAMGDRELDVRSDVYSLGVMVYEMLAGEPPYLGGTAQAIISKVLADDPDPVTKYRHSVPAHLDAAIRQALQKAPADRFATPTAFAEALSDPSKTVPSARAKRWRLRGVAFAGVMAGTVSLALVVLQLGGNGEAVGPDRSVAVLPFENLGGVGDAESFAIGLHDDVITQLSKISSITVISRPSVLQYTNTSKSVQVIGNELGVASVLVASIQWAGGRVRMNAQLINTQSDANLWAERFENELSVANLFDIQTTIAEQIAQALEAELRPTERAHIRALPTENLEAYEYYLRGNESRDRGYGRQHIVRTLEMYQRAVELDPVFATAYARLSTAHSAMYWFGHDRSSDRVTMAQKAVSKAQALAPDGADTHFALGAFAYRLRRDYARALEEIDLGLALQPSYSAALATRAAIQRRTGLWRQSIDAWDRAIIFDPRSANHRFNNALNHHWIGEFEEAERDYAASIALEPSSNWENYNFWAQLFLSWEGDPSRARAVLERSVGQIDQENLLDAWIKLDLREGQYQRALDRLFASDREVILGQWLFVPRVSLIADVFAAMGMSDSARVYYRAAASILNRAVVQRPGDERVHGQLGMILSALGLRDKAVLHAQRATELMPTDLDALTGPFFEYALALTYARLGDIDAAVTQLERVLGGLSLFTPRYLAGDPGFAGLRSDPRFQEMTQQR